MMKLEKELEVAFEFFDGWEYQKAYDALVKWLSGKKAADETDLELDEAWLEPICEMCFRVGDYETIIALSNRVLKWQAQPEEHIPLDVFIIDTIKWKAFRAEAKALMALSQSREVREAPPIQSDASKLLSVLQQRGAEK